MAPKYGTLEELNSKFGIEGIKEDDSIVVCTYKPSGMERILAPLTAKIVRIGIVNEIKIDYLFGKEGAKIDPPVVRLDTSYIFITIKASCVRTDDNSPVRIFKGQKIRLENLLELKKLIEEPTPMD